MTISNENGYMKLMGVIRNWHGDSANGVLGIFDFGKGNSFGSTLISIGMN